MAVDPGKQMEFTARLVEAERRCDRTEARLDESDAVIATMKRLVVDAISRRQDSRLPAD